LLGGMFGGAGNPGAAGGSGGGMGFRAPRGPRRGEDLLADTTLTFRQSLEGAMLSLRVEDARNGSRTVTARLPAGVKDGQKVRLRGKGQPGDQGAEPGDVVVTVHVAKHPLFTIEGDDVRITVPVTFAEAALGASIDVPTTDGSTVKVKVPAGTPSGRTLRVKGRGVQTTRRTGDLLVTIQVAVPQKVDGKAREALEAFTVATAGEDPRADLMRRLREAT
jgi:molecular chaperone DnaJ